MIENAYELITNIPSAYFYKLTQLLEKDILNAFESQSETNVISVEILQKGISLLSHCIKNALIIHGYFIDYDKDLEQIVMEIINKN